MNQGRAFTPEEDAFILRELRTRRFMDVGRELGRHMSAVHGRYRWLVRHGAPDEAGRYRRIWTEEEDEELLFRFRAEPMARIAERLNRPEAGCRRRLFRLIGSHMAHTIPAQSFSVPRTAALFGTSDDDVQNWIRIGVLRSVRVGAKKTRNSPYHIPADAIREFIRACWDRYAPHLMEAGAFRDLAEQVHRDNLLLSVEQAARIKGCMPSTIQRAVRNGILTRVPRPGTRCQYFIDRRDLDRWQVNRLCQDYGRRSAMARRRRAA